MDRALALAETGLGSAFPLPGRTADRYGQRSGICLSVYDYPSSGRGGTLTGRHYVMAVRRDARGPGRFPRRVRSWRWTCRSTGAS
jgi:hypothetical protein